MRPACRFWLFPIDVLGPVPDDDIEEEDPPVL